MGKKRSIPLADAPDAMRRLVAWCSAQGVNVRRTSKIQIKVGPFNCWPEAETWNRDDDQRRKHGLNDFKAAGEQWAMQRDAGAHHLGVSISLL